MTSHSLYCTQQNIYQSHPPNNNKQNMKTSLLSFLIATLVFNITFAASSAPPPHHHHHHHHHHRHHQDFRHCLTLHSGSSSSISQLIYTPNNSSFTSIWRANINNKRFDAASTPRPFLIVAPIDESQTQTVVYCSKKHGIKLRIRGCGHDFEGVSYTAEVPFVMLDLTNMRSISVDVASKTAWVQGGASLGEVYYRIAQKSRTLAFPGGTWSTVGVGGLISGGGYGTLNRKYGLAADHVIDARLVDAEGKILDRKSMGEDLFWAIRGGGASSFGVIVAWKLNLVDVPETVTVFATTKTLEQNATSIFHKWQYFAPNADRDLFLRAQLTTTYSGTTRKKTVLITFDAVFLGRVDRLMRLMQDGFPELGLVSEDCTEVSWAQSAMVISGFSSQASPEILLNRSATAEFAIKGKSDFVKKPISVKGIEGMWRKFLKIDVRTPNFVLSPYGGRMNEISDSAIPFPHRAGNLYVLLEWANLDIERPASTNRRLSWMRNVYSYLAPYVSNSPRSSYMNYNDFDLGVSAKTYAEASIWGTKYYGNNFERLVRVKSKVDPKNFFNHPQSIPPFPSLF